MVPGLQDARWRKVSERFALFAKAGVLFWDASVSARSFGRIETFSGEDLLAGVGARYSFPRGLGLLIEHERVGLDVRSTTVGVRWRF
jgi:hypothetical protein